MRRWWVLLVALLFAPLAWAAPPTPAGSPVAAHGRLAVKGNRVVAQEPALGVLYIVTEYIDGKSLSDALGQLRPDADELGALLRRLAAGLAAAHRLGAIHRDVSPDNVLLGGGELSRAKLIDFGIAKDLDPGTATIVGDGFAGKLGYVARARAATSTVATNATANNRSARS